MADRQMSYDLDGVFATRNQGQLVTTQAAQAKMVRTPGLMPVTRTALGDEPSPPPTGTINLPVIGPVKTQTALMLAGAGVLAFWMMRRRH